jgi:hypothetical protein
VAYDRSPSVEPRLRASWRVPGLTDAGLNGAVGLYDQWLAGVSDRRDASSVFTAWVRPPLAARMRSIHAQANWEQSIGAGFSYSLDAYHRWMYDLPVTTWSTVARFTPDLSLAHGRSYGADVRVELRQGPLYLFGGYAYGWMEYRSEQELFGIWYGEPLQSFRPPHDRRHQATALASLLLGEFTLATHWEYGSGFSYTRPMGFFEWIDFRTDQRALPRLHRTFGETQILLERPYDARLPSTHRLNVSVKRLFEMGARTVELQAGVINAYDQTNIFYYDVFVDRRIDQLPLTPYVSVQLQLPTRP